MNVIDLFAGAGGLSEGFAQAGFNIVGHVEMDRSAADTLRTRMIYYELKKIDRLDVYEGYLKGDVTRDDIVKEFNLEGVVGSVICEKIDDNYKDIIKRLKKIADGQTVDLLIGGPPCQAYSYIGRARDVNRMQDDKRNYLYEYYVEFLKAFKPKVFVFENVPGLITAGGGKYLNDMRELMDKAGYKTDYKILNAADYGVPQNRRRVILIGWSKKSNVKSYPLPPEVERSYKVQDVLADLPPLQAGGGDEVSKKVSRNSLLEEIGVSSKDFDLLLDHRTRPHNARDLEIYRHAVKLKNRGENLKYNNLPDELKTHKNQSSFLDRFKVVDMDAEGSHTVVAHIGKDGHYYIHPDLRQNRSLSVREAARLQTFPDDFKFEGSRNARYKQIGNAVPVLLAKNIAYEIKKHL